MKEYDVERFWRDQRLLRIGEGTSEIQRVIISPAGRLRRLGSLS
jgi:short-chain 2-methylacyl-CoA dehydrogenase